MDIKIKVGQFLKCKDTVKSNNRLIHFKKGRQYKVSKVNEFGISMITEKGGEYAIPASNIKLYFIIEEEKISSSSFIQDLDNEILFIRDLLISKNRKYGDSALNPIRICSKSDAVEQINVRIDDKLSRLRSMQKDEDEDVTLDLIGYFLLKRIALKRLKDGKK